MQELLTINASLTQIQKWMLTNAPGVTFRPPADPAAINHFARLSGLVLPDELVQTLLMADGETRTSAGAVGNWRFMPITEIQAAWGLLTQLMEKGAFADLTPHESPYIQKSWWRPGWIPIVSSETGDYFCLDTDPPEAERSGQVILFFHNRPERPLIAASLRHWFDRITRDLADGIYTFNEQDGFNGEALMWSALEGKHLLDDIGGKLIAKI